jgi:hypothetical protein
LIRSENERIPLTNEDLDGIDCLRLVQDTVGFNYDESVTIDGENIVGIAANIEESESVSLASRDRDNCQRSGGISSPATKPIDQHRVWKPSEESEIVGGD